MDEESIFYMLDENHNPVPVNQRNDVEMSAYAEWFKNPNSRRVALDEVGETVISTVFLGLKIPFYDGGKMFETAVFNPDGTVEYTRSATWDEALKAHQEAVEMVRSLGEIR